MDWLDALKQRLFGEAMQRTGQLHHGPLIRSTAFEKRHAQWLGSREYGLQLNELRTWFDRERQSGLTAQVHLFSDAKATGMQVQHPEHWPAHSLHHLLDAFRDRVIELGYHVQVSDHRINVDGVQRERHYLKPDIAQLAPGATLDQRYGNILLEAWGPGEDARHLKVLATVYNDRLYSPPLSGMELLSTLLEVRGLPLS